MDMVSGICSKSDDIIRVRSYQIGGHDEGQVLSDPSIWERNSYRIGGHDEGNFEAFSSQIQSKFRQSGN